MAAIAANPKIARGLNDLYAQTRKSARGRAGARTARNFGFIDLGAAPREDPWSPAQPVSKADLLARLAQFAASTSLPSKLWPTETLRQAMASFVQSLKDEARASLAGAGREPSEEIGAVRANA
jgi:hypothetical protein|nr:hypothetical protein [uncultured bacterium]